MVKLKKSDVTRKMETTEVDDRDLVGILHTQRCDTILRYVYISIFIYIDIHRYIDRFIYIYQALISTSGNPSTVKTSENLHIVELKARGSLSR